MNADLIFARLSAHPILRGLTLDGVVTLTRLASHLKRDILQPQSISESNPNVPPAILPLPIAMFLSASIGIPINVIAIHLCFSFVFSGLFDSLQMS